MLKLLGSACVLAAGVLARYRQVAEQRQQTHLLRELANALEAMCDGIRVDRVSMPRLLRTAGRNCGGEAAAFFAMVQARSPDMGIQGAWKAAAELLSLGVGEKELLRELGNCLTGDEEQVCGGLRAAAEGLRRELARQREQAADAEKRTTALCLSASALIIILLI